MDLKNVDIFAYVDNFKIHEHIESIEIKKSEKDDYFLSIVIPTYKRPKELKETIDSALNQEGDLFEYEVLVVDNNPERDDETEQLIATYTNSNLRYVKNSENLGMFGNWNRGFLLAKGGWLTMLHDDDMLYPYFLRSLDSLLQKDKDICIAPRYIRGTTYQEVPSPNQFNFRRIYKRYFINGDIVGPPVGLTVKKNVFISTGGYNADFYPSADYHWYVLFVNRYKLYQIIEPLAFYRTSISESNNIQAHRGWIIKDYYIKRYLLRKTITLPHCLIDYFLGLSSLARVRSLSNIYGKHCEFKLSDIGLSNRYSGIFRSVIAYVLWKIWRFFMLANLSTLKIKKNIDRF